MLSFNHKTPNLLIGEDTDKSFMPCLRHDSLQSCNLTRPQPDPRSDRHRVDACQTTYYDPLASTMSWIRDRHIFSYYRLPLEILNNLNKN